MESIIWEGMCIKLTYKVNKMSAEPNREEPLVSDETARETQRLRGEIKQQQEAILRLKMGIFERRNHRSLTDKDKTDLTTKHEEEYSEERTLLNKTPDAGALSRMLEMNREEILRLQEAKDGVAHGQDLTNASLIVTHESYKMQEGRKVLIENDPEKEEKTARAKKEEGLQKRKQLIIDAKEAGDLTNYIFLLGTVIRDYNEPGLELREVFLPQSILSLKEEINHTINQVVVSNPRDHKACGELTASKLEINNGNIAPTIAMMSAWRNLAYRQEDFKALRAQLEKIDNGINSLESTVREKFLELFTAAKISDALVEAAGPRPANSPAAPSRVKDSIFGSRTPETPPPGLHVRPSIND